MKAIACVSSDGYLLPAHLTPREDKRRFAALTAGAHCIVGRKTWDELPVKMRDGGAGRTYTILTNTIGVKQLNALNSTPRCAEYQNGLGPTIESAWWIIGGNQIYAKFAEWTDLLYLSTVKITQPMNYDVGKFPIDVSDAGRQDWDVLLHQDHGDHAFEVLRRRL